MDTPLTGKEGTESLGSVTSYQLATASECLEDACRQALSPGTRIKLAFDAVYIPLLVRAAKHGYQSYGIHPARDVLDYVFARSRALACGDVALAYQVLEWLQNCYYDPRAPLPSPVEEVIAWAKRMSVAS